MFSSVVTETPNETELSHRWRQRTFLNSQQSSLHPQLSYDNGQRACSRITPSCGNLKAGHISDALPSAGANSESFTLPLVQSKSWAHFGCTSGSVKLSELAPALG